MPIIHFDCLLPNEYVLAVQKAFDRLSVLLQRDAKVESVSTTHIAAPSDFTTELVAQLRKIYEDEYHDLLEQVDDQADDDCDQYRRLGVFAPKSLKPHRFAIVAENVGGSINQLAMLYSRILTPPAQLPADAITLEQAEQFEIPARFPWAVHVYP